MGDEEEEEEYRVLQLLVRPPFFGAGYPALVKVSFGIHTRVYSVSVQSQALLRLTM